MNAKNIDDTFKTVCTQLRTAAQRIRGFDDRHNLALLTRAAICIYIAEMLANGFRIGTSPTPLLTTEPVRGCLRGKSTSSVRR